MKTITDGRSFKFGVRADGTTDCDLDFDRPEDAQRYAESLKVLRVDAFIVAVNENGPWVVGETTPTIPLWLPAECATPMTMSGGDSWPPGLFEIDFHSPPSMNKPFRVLAFFIPSAVKLTGIIAGPNVGSLEGCKKRGLVVNPGERLVVTCSAARGGTGEEFIAQGILGRC